MKWHGVTWNNIDWNKKTVVIEKAYARVKKTEYKDGEIVTAGSKKDFKDLKTKSSYRTIGLNDAMINILKQHKEEQKKLAIQNGKEFKETDWVFTTKVYSPDSVTLASYLLVFTKSKSSNFPVLSFL